jgi:hypothetical protein
MPGRLGHEAHDLDEDADEDGPKIVAEGRRILQAKNVEVFCEEDCVKVQYELEEECTSLNSVEKR